MTLITQIAWCGLWLAVVFSLSEFLRRQSVNAEVVRKVVHIGVGNIIVLAWFLAIPRALGVVFGTLFCCVALLSYQFKILPSLNGVARRSFGTFFYALSITLLLAWFWQPETQIFAVIGILVMTWGDAIAALVGQAWGRHRYQIGTIRKSWEGSGAMWFVSAIVIGGVLGVGTYQGSISTDLPLVGLAIGIGAIASFLEVFSWGGLDNLTVPLSSSALCYWLLHVR